MRELNLARMNNSHFSNHHITVCSGILDILNLPKNVTNISIREEKNGAYELKVKVEEEFKKYNQIVYKRMSGYDTWYERVGGEFYKRETTTTTYWLNGEKIELPLNLEQLITKDISFNVYYL